MADEEKTHAWTRGGAVASAALASMCCILPLGFGALGISTSVVAGIFEPLRPWFLTLAALLLSAGFFFAFRRPVEGEACATNTRTISRLSKPTLWISTVLVIGLAFFSSFSGIAAGGNSELAATTDSKVVVLAITGMTCEACTPAVRTALMDVPGVIDAAVSYEHQSAQVRVRVERPPHATALLAAVKTAGYSAVVEFP